MRHDLPRPGSIHRCWGSSHAPGAPLPCDLNELFGSEDLAAEVGPIQLAAPNRLVDQRQLTKGETDRTATTD